MNVKKSVLIICFMLMLTTIPLSQANVHYNTNNTDNSWMQTHGRFFNDEMGLSVQQTDDGGFIVVGAKSRSLIDIHSHRDVWLIKLDETGSVIWDKTFGRWANDVGNSVQQTLDGGYIITGYTESYSNGKKDVWLIKTDERGKKLWDKTFGYSDFDSGSEVKQTSDGGYIIIGKVNTSGGGRGDVWLIKVDSNGNKMWDKSFGGKGHNYADEIQQTQDEGYIIIGSSWIPDESNSYDMWLIKVDKNGNMMWDKKFNRSESDHGWSIDQTVDGGFIIAGETNHGSDDKVWLLKTDESGNKIWDKTFEGRGFSVQQTNEGGYIIAGTAMNPTKTDFSNGLLIKTDSNGEQEWRKTFGGRKPDFLFSVQQTTDNGYIATGHTSQSWFDSGLWLIKIDSEGNEPRECNRNSMGISDSNLKAKIHPYRKIFPRVYSEGVIAQIEYGYMYYGSDTYEGDGNLTSEIYRIFGGEKEIIQSEIWEIMNTDPGGGAGKITEFHCWIDEGFFNVYEAKTILNVNDDDPSDNEASFLFIVINR